MSADEGFCFSGVETGIADRASEADCPELAESLQDRFDPLVEARLAQIVVSFQPVHKVLRDRLYSLVEAQHTGAVGDLDKRVATAIRKFLLRSCQFVCELEILLLKSKELGVVSEEAVLRLENLFVEAAPDRREVVEVPDLDKRPCNVSSCGERCCCSSYKREIDHGGSC